ncbi:glycolate oxidase subunit GlcF [Sulfuritalea sp.]|uniref:glycolate oxidase subunit GlcF n=1 Tax=Sulfuritalea sp. TaxID=2480090 RepID=UPI001AC57D66|nr:glycolate oxidase subunit GlcF [Sulfuritalea sp.]MBN8475049.1 glycolate oxidase subunit GlcF [Sulfuritalea sp.]
METHLADFIRHTTAGREAEEILRRCVHCGFCTATCPTYQLLGDELDGPRGRIYLIKQVLEGTAPTEKTRLHLDRCLTCRSCESTCPSGVHYSRLLDIGREVVERKVPRSGGDAMMRGALKTLLPRPTLFGAAMKLGQSVRLMLPGALRAKVPPLSSAGPAPHRAHARKMIALAGCVQPSMYPNINGATRRVLDRLGIEMIEARGAGCCGAVRLHLNEAEGARDDARRNIDAWWPLLEAGAEHVVTTASGCGTQVVEYAHLLQEDPDYATKSARVVLATRDVSEVILAEADALKALLAACPPLAEAQRPLAFHSPCSLQHGLKIRGTIEALLVAAGYTLTPVADSHLCCGSAGTYSVLQPEISQRLQANKLHALSAGRPAAIASANVGCIAHLGSGTELPVRHWIELLDARFSA